MQPPSQQHAPDCGEQQEAKCPPNGLKTGRPAAALFDLDGTLLNTLPGLAASLNHALRLHGEPERTLDEVCAFVGNGVRRLVARAANGGESRPDFDAIVADFRMHYAAHAEEGSSPYPGIPELLDGLRSRGVRLAVVTNKDESFACALIERFFPGAFDAVIGATPGRPAKPDPAAPMAALAALHIAPREALYVGDSGVDAATAANAGIPSLLCSWGFRPRAELLAFGPVVDSPAQILALFAP